MNRIYLTFFAVSVFAMAGLAGTAAAQQGTPAPAPTLPPGMVGANANDPRAKLSPGLYDAQEAALGIRHITSLKKPDAFQLGTDNADDPKVLKTLASLGIGDPTQMPAAGRLVLAQLAFSNSDMAFQENNLFVGNFYGISIYDIADPAKTRLLTTLVCPGGQGDVSVYKNLMFMSVEMTNGRLDCGPEGIPATPGASPASKDRFRGVRIFDISDISNPKQVAAVQTCRGSHTHTLVTSPNDKNNAYIYVSGTSFVRPAEELAGCSGGKPGEDPNTALFRIDVIKVPLAAPQDSKIVATPRIFGDPKTGAINFLTNGGTHSSQGVTRPVETDQCHDITVYPELGLAAGACSGNGILLDIKNPADPKRLDAVNDTNYAYWHSASFSNDGRKVVFTDEWGGGTAPRCRETDPNKWGANALFELEGGKLKFNNYYKLPAAQSSTENCVAHNGSLVPVPGRDIKVQAWYQGGISVMDFTDPNNPVEIAYFDRGPIDPNVMIMGGFWSAYWYNGHIYATEMARGIDVLELTPTENLTQNEIDAAKAVRMSALNVQTQERYGWPRTPVVAKAYLDQLERSQGLPANQIAAIRQGLDAAETNKNGSKLKSFASAVDKQAKRAKNSADAARLQALADILRRPSFG